MNFNMDEWNVIKKEDGTEYLERKDVDAIRKRVEENKSGKLLFARETSVGRKSVWHRSK